MSKLESKAREMAQECVDYYAKTDWAMEQRTDHIADAMVKLAREFAGKALREAEPMRLVDGLEAEDEIAAAIKAAEESE